MSVIFRGTKEPVTIVFDEIDLSIFEDIKARFGDDERLLSDNSGSIVVVDNKTLDLFYNDTSETNSNDWYVYGKLSNDEWKVIVHPLLNKPKLNKTVVE